MKIVQDYKKLIEQMILFEKKDHKILDLYAEENTKKYIKESFRLNLISLKLVKKDFLIKQEKEAVVLLKTQKHYFKCYRELFEKSMEWIGIQINDYEYKNGLGLINKIFGCVEKSLNKKKLEIFEENIIGYGNFTHVVKENNVFYLARKVFAEIPEYLKKEK